MNCKECLNTMWPEDPRVGFTDFHTQRYYPPICLGCSNESQQSDVEDRVGNLEAISAQAGGIPRRYYDQFRQMSREIVYLRNKLNELLGNKRQPIKSGYKGLLVNGS